MPQEISPVTSLNKPSIKSKKLTILITAILLILLAAAAFLWVSKSKKADFIPKTVSTKNVEETEIEKNGFYHNQQNQSKTNPYLNVPCESNSKVSFPHDFAEVDKILSVEPTIITPGNSRHRAWLNINRSKAQRIAVYAPVDSDLVGGVYKNARGALDYDLHFQVSCEIWYLINHVTDPVDKIKGVFPTTPQTDTRINGPLKQFVKVKAGELIGYTTGTPTAHNFDFGVFDLNNVNEGLPADEGSNYGKEKNFICPFDVLPTELKTAYYSKIISSEKPFTNCKN